MSHSTAQEAQQRVNQKSHVVTAPAKLSMVIGMTVMPNLTGGKTMPITGGCQCGAVRYEVIGEVGIVIRIGASTPTNDTTKIWRPYRNSMSRIPWGGPVKDRVQVTIPKKYPADRRGKDTKFYPTYFEWLGQRTSQSTRFTLKGVLPHHAYRRC